MSYVGTNLGMLPGATGGSCAVACSTDGAVTVGGSYDNAGALQAVWWDPANVIHRLPADTSPTSYNLAFNCSDTGLKIVGAVSGPSYPGLNFVPAVWTWPFLSSPAILPFPGQGVTSLNALVNACSVDGTFCVGQQQLVGGPTQLIPLVWTGGIAATLPLVPGYDSGVATDISSLGDVIVGYCFKSASGIYPDNDAIPVRWTSGPGWTVSVMGTLAGGVGPGLSNNFIWACNSDGSLAVGNVANSSNQAFASEWLGTAVGRIGGSLGGAGSAAFGCNAQGVFIVGSSAAGTASLWNSLAGQTLPPPGGLLSVQAAHGVSSDAAIVVGGSRNIFTPAGAPAVKWNWVGPGSGPVPGPFPPVPASVGPFRFLLCQPSEWSITAPVVTVTGLDHLAGSNVIGLADGVLVGPLLVSSDGVVTLPFPASNVTLGLSFQPQVQTTYLDAGNPTVQGRRKDVIAVTARVRSSSGVQVGSNQPDGAALDPPQNAPLWSGMQTVPLPPQSPSYVSPSGQTVYQPITGDLRQTVLSEWETPGQIAIQGTPGLPIYVLAVIPELLSGDEVEQTFSKEQAPQRREPRSERGNRAVPGHWMINGE